MLLKLEKYYFTRRKVFIGLYIALVGVFFSAGAAAGASGTSIAGIATNIDTSIHSIVKVLEDISLITGVGFIIGSFFKFHQHKLNPTQVGMSQGVTLLIIGAGLAVFPHLLDVITQGVFGVTAAHLGAGISSITKS